MAGRAYTIFETPIGRCGIAWGDRGVLCVRMPEPREIEMRRRLLQQYPDAREVIPPTEIVGAVEAMVSLLGSKSTAPSTDLTDILLDTDGMQPFQCRVYELVRRIPRGETRTYAEIAAKLGASGAVNAVGQAIRRNPFALIVPCHRALESAGSTGGFAANGSVVTKFRLLSIEGAFASSGPTLMDVLFPASRPWPQV